MPRELMFLRGSVRVDVNQRSCLFLSTCAFALRAVGKAVELNKQRSPKLLSQPAFAISEQSDCSAPNSVRCRGNQLSEGSDTSAQSLPSSASPAHSPPTGQTLDTSGQDSDPSKMLLFNILGIIRVRNRILYNITFHS